MPPKRAASPAGGAAGSPAAAAAKKPVAKASPSKASVKSPAGKTSAAASPAAVGATSPSKTALKAPAKKPVSRAPSTTASSPTDGATSPAKKTPSPKKAVAPPATGASDGKSPAKKAPSKTSSKLSKAPPAVPSKSASGSAATSRAASAVKPALSAGGTVSKTASSAAGAAAGASPTRRKSSASPTAAVAASDAKAKKDKKDGSSPTKPSSKDKDGKSSPIRRKSVVKDSPPESPDLDAVAVSSNASGVFELDPLDPQARPSNGVLTSLEAIYNYDPRSHLLSENLQGGLGKFYFRQAPVPMLLQQPPTASTLKTPASMLPVNEQHLAGARGIIPAVCPIKTTCHIRDVRHTHTISDSLLSLFSTDGATPSWETLSKLAPIVPATTSDRSQAPEAVQFRTALKQLYTAFCNSASTTPSKAISTLPTRGTVTIDPETLAVSVSSGSAFTSLVQSGRVQRNGVQFSNVVFQVPVNPEYAEWEAEARAAWRERRRADMLEEKKRRATILAAKPAPTAPAKAAIGKKTISPSAAAANTTVTVKLDAEDELALELEDRMYFDEADPLMSGTQASRPFSSNYTSSVPLGVDVRNSLTSAAICKSLLADAIDAMVPHAITPTSSKGTKPSPSPPPPGGATHMRSMQKGLPVNVVIVTDGDFSVEPIVKPKDPRLLTHHVTAALTTPVASSPPPPGLRSVREALLGKDIGSTNTATTTTTMGGGAVDTSHIVSVSGMDSLHQIGTFLTRSVHEFLQAHEPEIVAAAALIVDSAPTTALSSNTTIKASEVSPVTFTVGLGELVLHPQTCRNGAEALGGMCDILSTGFPDASLYQRVKKTDNKQDGGGRNGGSDSSMCTSDSAEVEGTEDSGDNGSEASSGEDDGSASSTSSSLSSSSAHSSNVTGTHNSVLDSKRRGGINRAGARKLRVVMDPCLGLEDEATILEEESGYRGLVSSQQMRQILRYQEKKGMAADGIIHGKPSKKLIRQLGLRVRDFYPNDDGVIGVPTSNLRPKKETDPLLRRYNKRFNFISVDSRDALNGGDAVASHVGGGEERLFPEPLGYPTNDGSKSTPKHPDGSRGSKSIRQMSPAFFGYQCYLKDLLQTHPLHYAPPAVAHLAILEHLHGGGAATADKPRPNPFSPHEHQASGNGMTTRARTITTTNSTAATGAGPGARPGGVGAVSNTVAGYDERYTPGMLSLDSCVEVAPWWTASLAAGAALDVLGGSLGKRASVVTIDTSPTASRSASAAKGSAAPTTTSALASTIAAHRQFALDMAALNQDQDGLPSSAVEFDHSNPVMSHIGRVALLGSITDAASNGASINVPSHGAGGGDAWDTLRSEVDKGHMLSGLRLTAPAVVGLPLAGSYKLDGVMTQTPVSGVAVETTISHRQKVQNILGLTKEAFERDVIEKCLYAVSTSSSGTCSRISGGSGATTTTAVDFGMSAGFVLTLCLKVKKPRKITTTETVAAPPPEDEPIAPASSSPSKTSVSPKKSAVSPKTKVAAAAPTTRVVTRTVLDEVIVGQLNITILQKTGAVPPPASAPATSLPSAYQEGSGSGVGLTGATLLSSANDIDALVNGWEAYDVQQVFGDGTIQLPEGDSSAVGDSQKSKYGSGLGNPGTIASSLGYHGLMQDAYLGERTGLLSFLSGLRHDTASSASPAFGESTYSNSAILLNRRSNPVKSVVAAILATSGFISTVVQLHNRERKSFEQSCSSLATLQKFFAAHRSFVPLAALPLKQFSEAVSALEVGRVAAFASNEAFNHQQLLLTRRTNPTTSNPTSSPTMAPPPAPPVLDTPSLSPDSKDKKSKKDKDDLKKDKKEKKPKPDAPSPSPPLPNDVLTVSMNSGVPDAGSINWQHEKLHLESQLMTLKETVRSQQTALQEVHHVAATSPALTSALQSLLQASTALSSARRLNKEAAADVVAGAVTKADSPTKSPSGKSPPGKTPAKKIASKVPAAVPAAKSTKPEQDAVTKAMAELTKLMPPSLPQVLESALKQHISNGNDVSAAGGGGVMAGNSFVTRSAELYAQNTYLGGQNAQIHLRILELQRQLDTLQIENGAFSTQLRAAQKIIQKKDEQIMVMQEMLKSIFTGSTDKMKNIMNSVFSKLNKRGGKKAKLGAGSASVKSSVISRRSAKSNATSVSNKRGASAVSPRPQSDGGESPSKPSKKGSPSAADSSSKSIDKKKVSAGGNGSAGGEKPIPFLRPTPSRSTVVVHNEASLFGPVSFLRSDAPTKLLRQKVEEAVAYRNGGFLALNSAKLVSENEERALTVARFGDGKLPHEVLRDHQIQLREVCAGLRRKLRLISKGQQGKEPAPSKRPTTTKLGYYGHSDDGDSSSSDSGVSPRPHQKLKSNSHDGSSDEDSSDSIDSENSSLTSISRFTVSSTRYDPAPLQDLGDDTDFFAFGPNSTMDISWKPTDPYSSFFKFLAALRRQAANREGLRFLAKGGAVVTTAQASSHPNHPRTNTTIGALMATGATSKNNTSDEDDIGTKKIHQNDRQDINLEIPAPPARIYDPMVKLSDVYSFLEEYHRRFSEEILFGSNKMEDCMLPTYTGGPRMLGAVDINMLRKVAIGVVSGDDQDKKNSSKKTGSTSMQGLASIELLPPDAAEKRLKEDGVIAAGGAAHSGTRTGGKASVALLRGGASHRRILVQQFSDMLNPLIPDEYVPRVTEVSIQGLLYAGSALVATYEVPTPAFPGASFTKVNVRWLRQSAYDPDAAPTVIKGSRAGNTTTSKLSRSSNNGDNFYTLTDDDIGHFILLECTPVNSQVGAGMSIVAKSKAPVSSDVPTVTKSYLTFTPSMSAPHHPTGTPRVVSPSMNPSNTNCFIGDRLQVCFSLTGVPLHHIHDDAKETRVIVRWQRAAAGSLSTSPVPTDYFTFAEQVLDLAAAKANFEFMKKERMEQAKVASSPFRALPPPSSIPKDDIDSSPNKTTIVGPGGVKNILYGSTLGHEIATSTRPEVMSAYTVALSEEASRVSKLMSSDSGTTFAAFLYAGPEIVGCHIRAEITPIRGVEVSMEREARERLLVQLEERREKNRILEEETMAQAEFDGVLETHKGTFVKQQPDDTNEDVLSKLVPAKVRRRIHFAEELLEIFQQRSYPSPHVGGGLDDSRAGASAPSSSTGGPYDSSFVGAALCTRSVYINVPISVERLVIGALGSGSWSGVLDTDGSRMVRVTVSASQVVVTPCDDKGVPLADKKGGPPVGEVSAAWVPSATTTGPYLQIPPLFDPSRAAAYFRTLKATSSSTPADDTFNVNGYSSPVEPCGSDVESKILWLVVPNTSTAPLPSPPQPPQRFGLTFSDRADRDLFVLLFLYFSLAGRNRSAVEGVLGEALSKQYIYSNNEASPTLSSPPKKVTSTVLNSLSGTSEDPASVPASVAAQSIVAKVDERLEEKAVELMDFPQRELPGCEYSLLSLLSEYLAQNQPITW